MDQLGAQDIVTFLQAAEKWVGDELDLGQVQVNDRVLVRTQNTSYLLLMTGPHTAQLVTDRPDQPAGAVRIEGGTFGRSRMIKPRHLFCGGNLEFTVEQSRQSFTTSPIEALQWISRSPPMAPPA